MSPIWLRLLIISLLANIIIGCQMLDKGTTAPPKIDDLSLKAIANQNQQISRAIVLLEKGEITEANQLIDEVLIFNPKHPTALSVREQLTQNVESIFNTQRKTNYTVKSGDTLGEIAEKWLGNSLFFISLARLNNIDNPSLLQPGTVIQIPVTETSEIVVKEKRRSTANLRLLEEYRSKRSFTKGLRKANTLFIIDQHLEQLLQIQQLILDGYAKASISISEREKMISTVNEIAKSSRNEKQRAQYQRFIHAQSRLLFLDDATLLFDEKNYLQAADKLVKAKQLDKDINRQTSVFRMEKLLINKLHEQAVVFYRNHSLKKALSRWDLILQLQPANELAKKYRQRTQKLLNKLNQY
ncbi:LysM peptidoglycan-binding domain-containing protein [Aliikangiella coralliicola]|uniref:LysM peptidoglycan-binding domain-containing protein n=1 Tax=Aliikangiella coralliicola TaxID=2592383 RepID=A0A545UC01_9GAMM|nr:LysM domain-containing protein [Aliikangiella coralliicola]TQV86992.1 LysM peptidoglycan-binding domain-containing protein [Aliikangiella coralliicola]